MAVGIQVNLPAQPTAGIVEEYGLAGDGLTAPHSEARVRLLLDGDSGGGLMTMTIGMDLRWASLVSYALCDVASLSDAKQIAWRMGVGSDMALGVNLEIPLSFPGGQAVGANNQGLWCPPPVLLMPNGSVPAVLIFTTDNTDTEDIALHVLIYQFKIDAAKRVPLPILHSVLSRGTSHTTQP